MSIHGGAWHASACNKNTAVVWILFKGDRQTSQWVSRPLAPCLSSRISCQTINIGAFDESCVVLDCLYWWLHSADFQHAMLIAISEELLLVNCTSLKRWIRITTYWIILRYGHPRVALELQEICSCHWKPAITQQFMKTDVIVLINFLVIFARRKITYITRVVPTSETKWGHWTRCL